MFANIIVHPRVNQRHPEISNADVLHACRNTVAMVNREYSSPSYYSAAGIDTKGRMLEIVGVLGDDGSFLVYHATKLTKKMMKELGL